MLRFTYTFLFYTLSIIFILRKLFLYWYIISNISIETESKPALANSDKRGEVSKKKNLLLQTSFLQISKNKKDLHSLPKKFGSVRKVPTADYNYDLPTKHTKNYYYTVFLFIIIF